MYLCFGIIEASGNQLSLYHSGTMFRYSRFEFIRLNDFYEQNLIFSVINEITNSQHKLGKKIFGKATIAISPMAKSQILYVFHNIKGCALFSHIFSQKQS